jgi:hypothetical protein
LAARAALTTGGTDFRETPHRFRARLK